MLQTKPIGVSLLTLAMVICAPVGIAHAQDSNVEAGRDRNVIVVTAQLREQTLQEVPISIAAVSGEQIEDRSIDSLSELSGSVPNLFINETQIDSAISVRGVTTGANKGFEQSVGMYFDGISYGRSQLIRTPLVDLARVEVLRGPQPTLFGKNAIAGAINVVSAKPTDTFEAKLSASYEFNHKEPQFLGVISGPIAPNLNGRLTASYRDYDGFIENVTLNRNEPSKEELYFRGQLEWDDGGALKVNLKGEFADFDTRGYAMENNTPIGSYTTNPFFSGVLPGLDPVDVTEDYRRQSSAVNSLNEMYNVVLTGDYEFDSGHTITSITGYVEYATTELLDVDYTALDLLDGTNQTEDYQQFSQELRLASPGGETVDYIGGLFYQSSDLRVTDEVMLGSLLRSIPGLGALSDSFTDRLFTQESEVFSAFAQIDLNLSEQFTITAGARYSHEKKDGFRRMTIEGGPTNIGIALPNPVAGVPTDPRQPLPNLTEFLWSTVLNVAAHQAQGSFTEDTFDPLLRVNFKASDDISLYASYTGGSKAGGFDVRSNSIQGSPLVAGRPAGTFQFAGERAENYEIGLKAQADWGSFNISAFRTDYKDLQTNVFDGVLGFLVQNAAEARTQGIEVDGRVFVTDDLQLYGSAAYLDYKFTDFKQGQCNFDERFRLMITTEFCDRTGAPAPFTAEWTGSVGFDYKTDVSDNLVFDLNGHMDFSSSYFLSSNLDPNQVEDGYAKFGAQVGIGDSDGAWRLSLIGDNLTNKRIKVIGGTLPLASTLTGGTGVAYDSIYARPRNIAIKLDVKFR